MTTLKTMWAEDDRVRNLKQENEQLRKSLKAILELADKAIDENERLRAILQEIERLRAIMSTCPICQTNLTAWHKP
jgi:DNA repair exonuclease SbcCD ATPase subunit